MVKKEHPVDIVAERYSYKMHGAWVRHKKFKCEGRISYYDLDTELVWVVWEASSPIQIGPHTIKSKGYSAGGYKPEDLLYQKEYEHLPWIDIEAAHEAYGRRKGA